MYLFFISVGFVTTDVAEEICDFQCVSIYLENYHQTQQLCIEITKVQYYFPLVFKGILANFWNAEPQLNLLGFLYDEFVVFANCEQQALNTGK